MQWCTYSLKANIFIWLPQCCLTASEAQQTAHMCCLVQLSCGCEIGSQESLLSTFTTPEGPKGRKECC